MATIEPLRYQSRLDIYIGSMFSGKSSMLIKTLSLLSEMGLKTLYINHSIDNRSETNYSTHSPLFQNCKVSIQTKKVPKLDDSLIKESSAFDVIGIDEAQFFEKELVTFVKDLVDVHKKYVIVTGLNGSYKREKMGYILDLIPIADSIIQLHAYCKRCLTIHKTLRPALFTYYTGTLDNIIVVGGAEKYQAVCRECYLELTSKN